MTSFAILPGGLRGRVKICLNDVLKAAAGQNRTRSFDKDEALASHVNLVLREYLEGRSINDVYKRHPADIPLADKRSHGPL